MNGKIYKIQCNDGYFYIGSTKNELRVRLQDHKNDSKKERNKNYKSYEHINAIGWNNTKIELINEIQCNNKLELRIAENEEIKKHLDNPLCLNTKSSYRNEQDGKDWFKYKRDLVKKKETDKKIYERNKEKLLTKVTCECGAEIAECGLLRHYKTKKHQDYTNEVQLNQITESRKEV